ncbi:MAG: hypothetical protein GY861_02780 [bacterium]|nr:hypothetical protein [bacterium]
MPPINFLNQLTQSGALNVVNPMESYKKALNIKAAGLQMKGAELDIEGKMFTLAREGLARTTDIEDYQGYRNHMVGLGMNEDLLPESFDSEEEYNEWKETAIKTADAVMEGKQTGQYSMTLRQGDGSYTHENLNNEQVDNLKNMGFGEEDIYPGHLSEENVATVDKRREERKKEEAKEYAPSDIAKKLGERNKIAEELTAQGKTADEIKEDPRIQAYDTALLGTDFNAIEMTEEEVDSIASAVYYGMKLPPFGRGKTATNNRTRVLKAYANFARTGGKSGREPKKGEEARTPMQAGLDILMHSADTKAIQGSMNMLDKQINSMESFSRNIDLQVDRVKEKTKGLMTYDTRLLNLPLRLLRGKGKGSPEQAIYDMYITEIESEIGKIATGSTQSIAELSTTAQEKWAKIHDKNLSWNDMVQLLDESSHAAKMRVSSVKAQQEVARNRMARKTTTGTSTNTIEVVNPETGETETWDLDTETRIK